MRVPALIQDPVLTILKGYAAILFLESPWAGLLLVAATFWYPQIGLAGLTSVIISYLTAVALRFSQGKSEIYVYNSMLVGLSLGAYFPLNQFLVMIILFSAILATLVTVAVKNTLGKIDNLPPLSLPFLIVAAVSSAAVDAIPVIQRSLQFEITQEPLIHPVIDTFLSTLGAIFFTPHPVAGLLVFAALLLSSRYLVILAICGFGTGMIGFQLLQIDISTTLLTWTGFNFILTAIALGGFFTVPGKASLFFALMAALLTVPLILVIQVLVLEHQIPIMVLPFVLITLSLLLVLKNRHTLSPPSLAPVPGIPENNYEQVRLATVRNGQRESVSVLPPFFGEWTVYQGMNGTHTHKPPWHYALDFHIIKDGRSYRNSGRELEDYICYGLPVVSPVHGTVVRCQDNLDDNDPGDVDMFNSWGNFILIRLDTGLHVLLAHFKQHSIKVSEGERVKPGTLIARCGNSGRSPQPHLHMHIQTDARLGSATYPFHLSSVITQGDDRYQYHLVRVPLTGETVLAIEQSSSLSRDLHLPVGRTLVYEIFDTQGNFLEEVEFYAELTLEGQYRFVSSKGGSTAYQEINGVLGFYDRRGGADRYLDMWLLANGLTPMTDKANHWQDRPSVQILPLTYWQRLAVRLWYPLGTGIMSEYERYWDEQREHWLQKSTHSMKLWGLKIEIHSESTLIPDIGFADFSMNKQGKTLHAKLVQKGIREDEGIPGWRLHVNTSGPSGISTDAEVRGAAHG